MASTQVEYLGFTVGEMAREYTLRVTRLGGEPRAFTLVISHQAFLDRRVRYQDAPDICFLKLQRALSASSEDPPATHLNVTDAELEEYRIAHGSRPGQRRS